MKKTGVYWVQETAKALWVDTRSAYFIVERIV